jgi:hypothetical protein
MNRRQFTAAALRLALGGAFARALAPPAARAEEGPNPSKVFREAGRTGADAFEFEMNGFAYHVSANGNGRRTKRAKARGFNVRLDAGESVTRALYSEFEGDLLLVLHTEIAGVGLGFVTRLEQPSMRGLWRQRIPSGDVGRPLREGRHLYVTGMGFVGQIDLRGGEYLWQYDDLEVGRGPDPKPLHAFDEPTLDGDAVLFRERPVYNPRRTLAVNRKTGKIIRVE